MYHFRSAQAAASTDAMSTVIDGADQAQYGLPYFAQDDKSTTNGLKYKVGSPKYLLGQNKLVSSLLVDFFLILRFCLFSGSWCRQGCTPLLCMVSLQMLTSFLETCRVVQML